MTINGLYLNHLEEEKINSLLESFFRSEVGRKIKQETESMKNMNTKDFLNFREELGGKLNEN